jgi:hypothetical protein
MSRNPFADPACPKCHGRGFIYAESMLDGGRYCECTMEGMRVQNMTRIWESLESAKEISVLRNDPPLKRFLKKSCRVTAPVALFKAHLKALAYNMPTAWNARVHTDAELLDVWFGTLKAQGMKIYDFEIENSTLRAIDIRDLVEPHDLCIILMGVKKLPNKEAPSSLAEAISYRNHLDKPTWVIDQPDLPLDGNHRYHNQEVERMLAKWPHVVLSGPNVTVTNEPRTNSLVATNALATVDDLLVTEDGLQEEEEELFEEDVVSTPQTKNLLSTLTVESKSKKPWKGNRSKR